VDPTASCGNKAQVHTAQSKTAWGSTPFTLRKAAILEPPALHRREEEGQKGRSGHRRIIGFCSKNRQQGIAAGFLLLANVAPMGYDNATP